MLLIYRYNAITLMNTILTITGSLFNTLSNVKIDEAYTSPGYLTNDYVITKSATNRNYKDAVAYCENANSEVFDPKAEMKILKLLYDFEVKKVWTTVFEHKLTEALVTVEGMPPITQTKDTVIGLFTDKIPQGHMVALVRKDDNTTAYETALATDEIAILCMKKLEYPNREEDKRTFLKAKEDTLDHLTDMKRKAEKVKRRVRNKMLAIPKLGTVKEFKADMATSKNYSLDVTTAWDREFDLDQRMKNILEVHIEKLKNEWTTMKVPNDLTLLMLHHMQFEQNFYNTLEEIQEPLLFPESMLEPEDRDKVDFEHLENRNPPMGMTEDTGRTLIFVHFRETGVDDSFPFLTSEKILMPYFDPGWEHFKRMNIYDMLLLIVLSFNTVFCVGIGINECIQKRDSYHVWKGWLLRKPVNRHQELFEVKKTSRRSSITSPGSEPETTFSLRNERKRDRAQEVKFQPKKKKQAPRPPKSVTQQFELVSPIDDQVYVSPPKPRNRPVYIRVVNAHQPVADADSDIDME
jgi:hypothetical protein